MQWILLMHPFLYLLLLLPLLTFFTDTAAFSAEAANPSSKPLWELGVTANATSIPLYRGSEEYKLYALPLPYFIYRGRFLQSDRDGIRGILYSSDYIETTFSGWGNPPVDENGTSREGMGDLDALVEFGPALKWHIFKRQPDRRFYLQAAGRVIFSIGVPDDLRTHHRGYRLVAGLNYFNNTLLGNPAWAWGAKTEIDFTCSQYNDYVYGVPEPYANDQRPAYNASGGYAGIMGAVYFIRRFTDTVSLAVYTRFDNIAGAVYESSPLVETQNNVTVAASLIWKLKESSESAPAN